MKKKEQRSRFQLNESQNIPLSDFFKTTEMPTTKGKKKIVITPKNSELVPKHVSYLLYPESGDKFSGKYLRARCAQRQRKIISEDEKAS